MKNIFSFVVNEFGTNSYIYKDLYSSSAILIDPGGETEETFSIIKKENLKIEKIIITHCHFDHIMSLEKVYNFFKVPIVVHKIEFESVIDNSKNLSLMFGKELIKNQGKNFLWEKVSDKDEFFCGSQKVKIIHTPGHTTGGICLFVNEIYDTNSNTDTVTFSDTDTNKYLFTGDTLFCGSVGRTDFPGGNMDVLLKSLKKIFLLPEETTFFPGHGNHCTLKNEKQHNPFYKH